VTAITGGQAKLQTVNGDLSRFGVVVKAYLQQQRRTHDMMKLRGGLVRDRLAHFLKLLARNADGSEHELGIPNKSIINKSNFGEEHE
jgi:hypothetical protein